MIDQVGMNFPIPESAAAMDSARYSLSLHQETLRMLDARILKLDFLARHRTDKLNTKCFSAALSHARLDYIIAFRAAA